MKTTIRLFALAMITLTGACSSSQHAGSSSTDDVYYSAKDRDRIEHQSNGTVYNNNEAQPNDYYDNGNSSTSTDYSSKREDDYYSTTTSDEIGNNYITNNYYYDRDDYYDYSYSASLRRYYMPAYGYSYYDPFYTNLYWYDYNPVSWGVSIYMGYNWWAPSNYYYSSWYPSIGFSVGWGYPYYSYGYGYYPYYGYGSCGYSPYWSSYNYGYYNGYNHGYYDASCGYNPYYYNSYDHYNSSVYYGPRGSLSSNSSRVGTARAERTSVGNLYEGAVLGGKVAATNPELPNKIRANSVMNSSFDETKKFNTSDVRPSGSMNNDLKDGRISTGSVIKSGNELTPKGINTTGRSDVADVKPNSVNKTNTIQNSPVKEQQNAASDSRPKTFSKPSSSGETIQPKAGGSSNPDGEIKSLNKNRQLSEENLNDKKMESGVQRENQLPTKNGSSNTNERKPELKIDNGKSETRKKFSEQIRSGISREVKPADDKSERIRRSNKSEINELFKRRDNGNSPSEIRPSQPSRNSGGGRESSGGGREQRSSGPRR